VTVQREESRGTVRRVGGHVLILMERLAVVARVPRSPASFAESARSVRREEDEPDEMVPPIRGRERGASAVETDE
jgi:hypothetical protein